ncbi:unnamed protein product, partial [Fusarium graminearum]
CHLPYAPMPADALLEWAELLSTQNFTDVILEDTSSNLVGLLRALSAFPFDDDFNAARKSVKSFSITIKDPSGQESHPERDALGSLPVPLAQTIHGMTNLQTISLDLGPFSVEDGQTFYNAVMSSPPKPIWRNMQSIRIRGLHVLAACIMCRLDYECLVAVDVDNWVDSHPFEKMVVIDNLDRVRLYYDKDHATSPVYNELKFPSTDTTTWKELMREADCDRSNEFTQLNHVQMIKTAFMNDGLEDDSPNHDRGSDAIMRDIPSPVNESNADSSDISGDSKEDEDDETMRDTLSLAYNPPNDNGGNRPLSSDDDQEDGIVPSDDGQDDEEEEAKADDFRPQLGAMDFTLTSSSRETRYTFPFPNNSEAGS